MYFDNKEHEKAYKVALYKVALTDDNFKNALIYLINADDLRHLKIYDYESRMLWKSPQKIIDEYEDDLSSTSLKTLKLALNLFNGRIEVNPNRLFSGIDNRHKKLFLTALEIFMERV